MINAIFWGIVALIIIIYRALDDSAKLYLLLGFFIVVAIYGAYTGSTVLMAFVGIPVLCLLILVIWIILYVIFHEEN